MPSSHKQKAQPRKKKSRGRKKKAIHAESFLKSINIVFDADQPSRIEHFVPTTKCVSLIRGLIGREEERSFFVVAPYGTGKSLTAVYALQVIENRPAAKGVLSELARRLQDVSKDVGSFAQNRVKHPDRQGIVLALHGAADSLAGALKSAAVEAIRRLTDGRQARFLQSMPARTGQDALDILHALKEKAEEKGFDRIAIVWDEFGRHLESLVAEGRGDALLELQTLAEFASRSADLPITLGLILHQGLLHYAGNAPQGVRSDWTKIEGRFRTIQYVDDSREIYRLVADVMADRRAQTAPPVTKKKVASLAQTAQEMGLFGDFNRAELKELLYSAWPLEPATLYLLPRISARVAQNERTLFSFLYSQELSDSVDPCQLYDYFSPAMRADTAVGGTHRQWLETESALSKVTDDPLQINILKTACLLGLGTSGERSRTERPLLEFAARGFQPAAACKSAVDALVARKLLLHRKHNDDISIWHGTDMDLRGKLDDEKRAVAPGFDLLEFLNREAPPTAWKPVEYNDRRHIRRYLTCEYHGVPDSDSYAIFQNVIDELPADSDGKVIYLLADTQEELEAAEEIAKVHLKDKRIVAALPSEPLPLTDAAVEVAALQGMQLNRELVESDPLALSELQQMTDDARNQLQRLVDRLLKPGQNGPRWYYKGNELQVHSSRALRSKISGIMEQVFKKAPIINNEAIVRKKPSPTIINSRKKLLLGLLERHGQADFGIQGHFPDKSMFRTVLLNTGLYRQDKRSDLWNYAAPSAIRSNTGLHDVWELLRKFLTVPNDKPKDIAKFLIKLQKPPIGLRAGVIPILFAAGLKAFATAVSITRRGEYLNDILPTDIEDICKNSADYRLTVLELDDKREKYLREIFKHFSAVAAYEIPHNDLIRQCFDALQAWKAQIPPAALTTRQMSPEAIKFRDCILRISDPVRLLTKAIPEACGVEIDRTRKLMNNVRACADELAAIAASYGEQAATAMRNSIGLGRSTENATITQVCQRWASCFSDSFVESLTDTTQKAFLTRLNHEYSNDGALLDSLGSLLVGRGLSRWDDSTILAFERSFQNHVRAVEDASLSSNCTEKSDGVTDLIYGRMQELYDRLKDQVGKDEAQAVLDAVVLGRDRSSLWFRSAK